MSIRETLARWLAPEAFRTVERYQFLRRRMEEVATWCGYEFPEIDAAMYWAKVSEVNHFRGLDDPSVAAVPGKPWIWQIYDFREHLRALAKERSQAGTTGRPLGPRDAVKTNKDPPPKERAWAT